MSVDDKFTYPNSDNISGLITRLNSFVNKTLEGDKLGRNRLEITYEPNSSNDPFGILWIEHFVCDSFSIEIPFRFKSRGNNNVFLFSAIYTYTYAPITDTEPPFNGVKFKSYNNQSGKEEDEWMIPAFSCSERNQCSNSKYTNLCVDPSLKLEIGIETIKGTSYLFKGNVIDPNEADKVIVWVWDFINAQSHKPFYVSDNPNGPSVPTNVWDPKIIRLTAITKNGCVGTANWFLKL